MDELLCGQARCEITPPLGTELAGYGIYRQRRSTEVLDPLWAKALVLRFGDSLVALVCCDLIGIGADTVRATRAQIAQETAIPASHVIISCTHTHSGPATCWLRGWGEIDRDYLALLPRYLAGCVRTAATRLQPAQLAFGRQGTPGLNHNRVDASQPVDEDLSLISLSRQDGSPLAWLWHFSCHPVVFSSQSSSISAEYPGAVCRLIAAELQADGAANAWSNPAFQAIFLQGHCGDVNPVKVHTGEVEAVGKPLAAACLDMGSRLKPEPVRQMVFERSTVRLPFALLDLAYYENMAQGASTALAKEDVTEADQKRAKFHLGHANCMLQMLRAGPLDYYGMEVSCLRLNDLKLVFHAGELFSCFGIQIKQALAPAPVTLVGYADDFVGYIPDRADFQRSGYAAAMVPKICDMFPYRPDVGETLVTQLLDFLAQV